jgi:hypothetical protein
MEKIRRVKEEVEKGAGVPEAPVVLMGTVVGEALLLGRIVLGRCKWVFRAFRRWQYRLTKLDYPLAFPSV